jgi:hypothetical protein
MRSKLELACLLLVVSSSACTHVHPWERSKLAHHTMTMEPTGPALEHVYSVHEGAVGGEGGTGSGCGCN